MIGRLLRLGVLGAIVAWLVERRLDAPVEPVRSVVVIDAPIERVWDELARIEGQPRWMHDLKSVDVTTAGPVRVGTRAVGSVRILGVGVEDPVTVTAFSPPTLFAIRHEGVFKGEGTITLEPGADGTTTIVRWEEVLIPPVLPRLGSLILRPILRDVFQQDLHALRQLIEA